MRTFDTNILSRASSEYSNFFFDSMVRFNGKLVGANGDGIFTLEGTDDDGVEIYAYIELADLDLGIDLRKSIRFIDATYESDGDLLISILMDDNTRKEQRITFDSLTKGKQARRKGGRRDNVGTWMRVRVENMDGEDFCLDKLAVLPIIHSPKRAR